MVPAIGYVQRWADTFVDGLLDQEPAILLEGPRGSGKSTLLRAIAARRDAMVIDLDDSSVLQFVHEDADAALASPGLVAIDGSCSRGRSARSCCLPEPRHWPDAPIACR